jgi:streptogramin lyase
MRAHTAAALALALALAGAACGSEEDGPDEAATELVTALDPVEDPAPGEFVVAVDFAALREHGSDPSGIAVDGDGRVFMGLRGTVARLDGDELTTPRAPVSDVVRSMTLHGGDLVVTDERSSEIYVSDGGRHAATVAGELGELADQPLPTGEPLPAVTPLPLVLDVAAGDDVYAAVRALPDDPATAVAQVVRVRDDEIEVLAGSRAQACDGAGGPAVDAAFGRISGVAVEAGGAVLAADGQCRRLWRITPGGVLEEVAGESALLYPGDVVVGPGGVAYVLDEGHDAVIAVGPDGTSEAVVEGLPPLSGLSQLALDGDGRLWITAGERVLLARPR